MENLPLKDKLRELDEMPRSVTSEEADLIEVVACKLKKGKRPTSDEVEAIDLLYRKYLERDEDDEKGPPEIEHEDDLDDTDL